jgi:hypothetical protein
LLCGTLLQHFGVEKWFTGEMRPKLAAISRSLVWLRAVSIITGTSCLSLRTQNQNVVAGSSGQHDIKNNQVRHTL